MNNNFHTANTDKKVFVFIPCGKIGRVAASEDNTLFLAHPSGCAFFVEV